MSYQEIYCGLNKRASNEQIKKLASLIGMKKNSGVLDILKVFGKGGFNKALFDKNLIIKGYRNGWLRSTLKDAYKLTPEYIGKKIRPFLSTRGPSNYQQKHWSEIADAIARAKSKFKDIYKVQDEISKLKSTFDGLEYMRTPQFKSLAQQLKNLKQPQRAGKTSFLFAPQVTDKGSKIIQSILKK